MSPDPARGRTGRVRIAIPCRSLGQGKTRLAAVLSAEQRRDLVRSMLENVLAAACGVRFAGDVAVVTCDAEVAALAAAAGAAVVAPATDAGLSDACAVAAADAVARAAAALAILPADLPLVRPDDIEAAIARHGEGRGRALTLVEAASDGGTNFLMASPPDLVSFRFGPDSFARHVCEAKRAGVVPLVLDNPRLAFDVDVPADLDRLGAERERALRSR